MGDDLQSSLIFANVHQPIKTRLRDCSFSGKLAKDSFYIDGQSVGGSKPNFKINGCTFGSELKNRFNSKFISTDGIVNKMFDSRELEKKETFNSTFVILIAAVFAAVLATFALIRRKTIELKATTENYDLTFIEDDEI